MTAIYIRETRGRFRHGNTQERKPWDRWGSLKWRSAKDCWGPPEAGNSQGGILPFSLQRQHCLRGLLVCKTAREYSSAGWSHEVVVICYGSPRKQIHSIWFSQSANIHPTYYMQDTSRGLIKVPQSTIRKDNPYLGELEMAASKNDVELDLELWSGSTRWRIFQAKVTASVKAQQHGGEQ